jgi:hypothetical protein
MPFRLLLSEATNPEATMIELIFITCLAASPDRCEERAVALLSDVGLMGCLTTAQPQLALWSEQHPGYRVVRWSCGWVDRNAGST